MVKVFEQGQSFDDPLSAMTVVFVGVPSMPQINIQIQYIPISCNQSNTYNMSIQLFNNMRFQ